MGRNIRGKYKSNKAAHLLAGDIKGRRGKRVKGSKTAAQEKSVTIFINYSVLYLVLRKPLNFDIRHRCRVVYARIIWDRLLKYNFGC